jgi:signal transduction histidine kinase/CheY-like chemotaxis protein
MSFNPDHWRARQIEFFDLLAALNKALAQSPGSADPLPLFSILKQHIQPLFTFETHLFVAPNPETFEFEIVLCDPPADRDLAQKALDFTIEESTFAWSLKQNRAVTLRCAPLKKSLILHSIATQDHKYGMFIGITKLGGIHEMDFTLPMISAIIQRGAYSLERQKYTEKIKITKMEAIGLLAGGIAHNFNNVIQSIQGNIDLAQIELHETHPAKTYLLNAINACHRAALLSNQLLTFAKGGAPILKRFSLKSMIDEILADLQGGFGIVATFTTSDESPIVDADESQLKHAFSQLLQNAFEAGSLTGKVEIQIVRHHVTEDEITTLSPGPYWEIEIKDHGQGISTENLSRILEPYFTTKQGHSGLGLPAAFSILKNHGGDLQIQSVVNKGTSVKTHLPAAKETETCSFPPPSKTKDPATKMRVLHMDDEESLRNMIRAILQKNGFEVVSTCDSVEAIHAYQKSMSQNQKFDWVILDLMIPVGMGGVETIEKLREIDPHVRALVCSGYSNDPVMANPAEYGFHAVLKKPFQFPELIEILKRVNERMN